LFLIISYVFSSTESENKRAALVLPGGWVEVGEGAHTMYTHVSKCKNDKRKKRIANRSNFQMKRQPTEWKEILASFHSTGINIKKYQLKKKNAWKGHSTHHQKQGPELKPHYYQEGGREEGLQNLKI
jgi:hypothetical protein